jgi:hypothetical protein
LSTALFVKKFPFFSQVFMWGFTPLPDQRPTLDPSSKKKLCCLNSPFVRF